MGKKPLSKRIKLCGVIFINEHQFLVFHCAVCDDIFDTWDSLQDHFTNHFDKVNVKTNIVDPEFISEEAINPTEFITKYEGQDNYKEELAKDNGNEKFLEDDILVEEYSGEVPLETNIVEVPWDDLKFEVQLDNNVHKEEKHKIKEPPLELSIKQDNSASIHILEEIIQTTNTSQTVLMKKFDGHPAQNLLPKKYRRVYDGAVRKHKCEYCGFAFKDSSNLANHIRRHSGVKEYGCSYCPKEFYTRSELKAHERHHTGEQPFLCTICGKRFFNSGALYGHTKRHENKRLYKCDKCDKSFYDERGVQDHRVIHSNERNVKCPQCPATFKLKKTLSAHMKIHLNKREHRCHLCEASFNQRPGLISHLKATHRIVEGKITKTI